jgi:hypothetical protein
MGAMGFRIETEFCVEDERAIAAGEIARTIPAQYRCGERKL